MKKNLLLLIFTALVLKAKAQYTGGGGDGHSMAQINSVALSINEVLLPDYLNIYPNPASGTQIIVETSEAFFGGCIYVTDVAGRIIYEKKLGAQQKHKIDITAFKPGLYFVKVENETRYSATKLIIY